jgi:hypothetical protein
MGAYTGGAPAANTAAGGESLQSKLIALFESPQATSSDAGMSTDEVYAAFQSNYPAATIRQSVCDPTPVCASPFPAPIPQFLGRPLEASREGDACGRSGWSRRVVA